MSQFARFCGINSLFITLCRRMAPDVSWNGWLCHRMAPTATKGLNFFCYIEKLNNVTQCNVKCRNFSVFIVPVEKVVCVIIYM